MSDFLADRHDLAVTADLRRLALAEVKIGGAGVDEDFERIDRCRPWEKIGCQLRNAARISGFLLGADVGFFLRDEAGVVELHERVVHELHALLLAGLHDAGEHEGLGFADEVADGRRVRQDFQGEHAAAGHRRAG